MPKRKNATPAFRGGVTDGDTVNVPIQKKEGDTRLVLTVRASELTLDRGAVGENDTIEFKVKRSEGEGGDQLLLTHAVVERKTERLRAPIRTMDVGTPPEKAVRLWLVGFEKKKRDYAKKHKKPMRNDRAKWISLTKDHSFCFHCDEQSAHHQGTDKRRAADSIRTYEMWS